MSETNEASVQSVVVRLRKLAEDLEGGNYGDADKLVAEAADMLKKQSIAIQKILELNEELEREKDESVRIS